MASRQFRTAFRFRLGLPVYTFPHDGPGYEQKCSRCKHGILDEFGRHAVECPGKSGTIMRHEMVKDSVFGFARAGGYQVVTQEKAGLDPNSDDRPADIHIEGWRGGVAAVDVVRDLSLVPDGA